MVLNPAINLNLVFQKYYEWAKKRLIFILFNLWFPGDRMISWYYYILGLQDNVLTYNRYTSKANLVYTILPLFIHILVYSLGNWDRLLKAKQLLQILSYAQCVVGQDISPKIVSKRGMSLNLFCCPQYMFNSNAQINI